MPSERIVRSILIVAIGKEVTEFIITFEKILERIEQGNGFTEEESKAIRDHGLLMIDVERSLHRFGDCLPASDTTH